VEKPSIRKLGYRCFNKQGNQRMFALFAYHLTIEKLLKAIWIKDNIDNFPPRTHDLKLLYNATDLNLDAKWVDYLGIMNDWNIESRYPDYKMKLQKVATVEYIENHQVQLDALNNVLVEYLSM
jgi:HEPN domain-containing protein